jgi:hypothetical protein
MMLVIAPPGGRSSSRIATFIGLCRATAFFLGASTGATTFLGALALVGVHERDAMWARVLFATFALALAARDVRVLRFRMPQRKGQVKRETTLRHPLWGSFIQGFALGTAVYTFIPVSLVYAIFALPMLGLMNTGGAVLGTAMAFAMGRSLGVYARLFLRKIDADELAHRIMHKGLPPARVASAVCLAALAGSISL